ncbi:uncharacterized protein LOC128928384 [Callithrix jacchus]
MLVSSLQGTGYGAPASPEHGLAASPAELSVPRQLKPTQKPPCATLHVNQSLELRCPGREINEISPEFTHKIPCRHTVFSIPLTCIFCSNRILLVPHASSEGEPVSHSDAPGSTCEQSCKHRLLEMEEAQECLMQKSLSGTLLDSTAAHV